MVAKTRSQATKRRASIAKSVLSATEGDNSSVVHKRGKKQKRKTKKGSELEREPEKNKVCLLCHEKVPPLLIDEKGKSFVNKSKIKWIECDCCCQWIHAQCTGIEEEEFKKLPKEGTWFKCVICAVVTLERFHSIPKVGIQPLIQQAFDLRFRQLDESGSELECLNSTTQPEEEEIEQIGGTYEGGQRDSRKRNSSLHQSGQNSLSQSEAPNSASVFREIPQSRKKGIEQTEGRREKGKTEDNKSRSGTQNIGERDPEKRNPLQQPGKDLLGQLEASNSALDNTDIPQGRKNGIEPSEGQRPRKEQAEDIRNRSSSPQ